jgi:hypothetical protein
MGIFDTVKKTTIASRRYEEKLYEVALEEVENNEIRKGLYSKAISKADGDKEKADGIYLKLRVQSIMDDIESERINTRENARAFKAYQELKEFESINEEKETQTEKLNKAREKERKKNKELIRRKFQAIENTKFDELFTKAQSEIDGGQVDSKLWADAKGVEVSKGHNAAICYYIEKRIQVLFNEEEANKNNQ